METRRQPVAIPADRPHDRVGVERGVHLACSAGCVAESAPKVAAHPSIHAGHGHKPSVQAPPGLALVFNMDGFGAQAAKLSKYQALAADSRFALGFQMFYRQDKSPFTASDLLAAVPTPDVVEYR